MVEVGEGGERLPDLPASRAKGHRGLPSPEGLLHGGELRGVGGRVEEGHGPGGGERRPEQETAEEDQQHGTEDCGEESAVLVGFTGIIPEHLPDLCPVVTELGSSPAL